MLTTIVIINLIINIYYIYMLNKAINTINSTMEKGISERDAIYKQDISDAWKWRDEIKSLINK